MISRTKQIVYGASLALATGLAVPVVLDRETDADSTPRPELPAEGDPSPFAPSPVEIALVEVAPVEVAPVEIAPVEIAPELSAELDPAGDDAASRLERSLAALESMALPGAPDLDLWAASWAPAGAELAPAGTGEGGDALAAFLVLNPLCGILHGGERSAALFGGQAFSEGDQLPRSAGRIERIEPRRVTLVHGEVELELDLPPLGTRAAPQDGHSPEGESPPEEAPLPIQEDRDA